MSNYIGAKVDVSLGKETTRGTAVSPAISVPKTSFDFNDQTEYIQQEAPYGVIETLMTANPSKRMGQGTLEGPVFSESVGYILAALFGNFPGSTDLTNGAYQHDFGVQQNNTHQTLTIHRKEANENLKFALAMLQSVEFTFSTDGYIQYSASFMSQAGTTASGSTNYKVEYLFRPQDCTAKVADSISSLSGANATTVESFTLSAENNLEEWQALGSVDLNNIFNTRFNYSGSMTMLWNNTDFKGYYTGGTQKAVEIDATNTDETLGTSNENPQLKFQMSPSTAQDWSIDTNDNDSIMKQSVTWSGQYDLSNNQSLLATLKNEVQSY